MIQWSETVSVVGSWEPSNKPSDSIWGENLTRNSQRYKGLDYIRGRISIVTNCQD